MVFKKNLFSKFGYKLTK